MISCFDSGSTLQVYTTVNNSPRRVVSEAPVPWPCKRGVAFGHAWLQEAAAFHPWPQETRNTNRKHIYASPRQLRALKSRPGREREEDQQGREPLSKKANPTTDGSVHAILSRLRASRWIACVVAATPCSCNARTGTVLICCVLGLGCELE